TRFVPQAASGFLMKKELDYLGGALAEPKRPFVAVIGGSKVSSKIDVIKSLLPRVDKLLIGGGMTYTFLKAQGLEVCRAIVEIDATAKGTMAVAEALAKATAAGATTIIGGGDSASAVKKAGVASKVSHVSTGGGASLEFLEGKVLPGVAALTDK